MVERLCEVAFSGEGADVEAVDGDACHAAVGGKGITDAHGDVQLREDVLHGELHRLAKTSGHACATGAGYHPVGIARRDGGEDVLLGRSGRRLQVGAGEGDTADGDMACGGINGDRRTGNVCLVGSVGVEAIGATTIPITERTILPLGGSGGIANEVVDVQRQFGDTVTGAPAPNTHRGEVVAEGDGCGGTGGSGLVDERVVEADGAQHALVGRAFVHEHRPFLTAAERHSHKGHARQRHHQVLHLLFYRLLKNHCYR